MARFLFFTWDGAGNQPPAVAIARALESRGHKTVFAGYENQRGYFSERGLAFVLLEQSARKWRDEDPEHMFRIKLKSVWASSDHLEEMAQLMAQQHCDAAIIDCLMFGALAAAEKFQLPTAVLIHSAPGALMPPNGQFEALLLEEVNGVRTQAGLSATRTLWDAWAQFPALSNSIPELDPLASQAPQSFRFCGPMLESGAMSSWKSPWPQTDDRPLILVSFSTGPYWDQSSRILKTLKALERTHCRVLVTAGLAKIDAEIVPANAIVIERVRHEEILPEVALTVTHAGHGTVITSLKHGVPLLCLPNPVADQPILAGQVESIGCGVSLDGDNATSTDVKEATDRLLNDPRYTVRARAIAETISRSAGVFAAARELEALVDRSGAVVTAAE